VILGAARLTFLALPGLTAVAALRAIGPGPQVPMSDTQLMVRGPAPRSALFVVGLAGIRWTGNEFALASISAGARYTCGLTQAGGAMCWGEGLAGELGTMPAELCAFPNGIPVICSTAPLAVSDELRFKAIFAGSGHTCTILDSGRAYCWGDNSASQLGAITSETCTWYDGVQFACSTLPVAVTDTLRFASLTIGGNHTCGLTQTGVAYCWGLNDVGQLGGLVHETCGRTHAPCTVSPARVAGELRFIALTAGQFHTCGIAIAGRAYCWGSNASGALGTATQDRCVLYGREVPCSRSPVVLSDTLVFAVLSAGHDHTCGVTASGTAYCWGANTARQLGAPSKDHCEFGAISLSCGRTPVAVSSGYRFTSIGAGLGHTCALAVDGRAFCWGANDEGQLGVPADSAAEQCGPAHFCRSLPIAVGGALSFSALSVGSNHVCGLTSADAVYCWGENSTGEVGDGTKTPPARPVRVIGPRPSSAMADTAASAAMIADGRGVEIGPNGFQEFPFELTGGRCIIRGRIASVAGAASEVVAFIMGDAALEHYKRNERFVAAWHTERAAKVNLLVALRGPGTLHLVVANHAPVSATSTVRAEARC
jgi:alpha-tubulin suppressor-like RCC1 family protein